MNPAWGRFINADGIINADRWALGYNLYLYCKNNPVGYSDSNGKEGNFFTDWIDSLVDMIVPPLFQPKVKNNLVAEVGYGYGLGAGVGIGSLNFDFNYYQDITYKYNETDESVNGDISLGVGAFGYSHSYVHEYPFDKSEFNSDNHKLDDSNTIFDCTQSLHTNNLNTPVGTFSNNSYEFTLIDINLHALVGFHIKIGWEIDY